MLAIIIDVIELCHIPVIYDRYARDSQFTNNPAQSRLLVVSPCGYKPRDTHCRSQAAQSALSFAGATPITSCRVRLQLTTNTGNPKPVRSDSKNVRRILDDDDKCRRPHSRIT